MIDIANYLPKVCYLAFGFNKIPFYLQYVIAGLILLKPIKWLLKRKYFRYLIIFLLPSIIFINLVRNGWFFRSDDFAHLKIAAEYSFGYIFWKGMISNGIWGFHKFIGFWLFKTVYLVFGTKFEAFLVFNFLLNLVNISIFYQVLNKIKKNNMTILIAFIYGGFYLSWLSNIHDLIAGTFFLLTILFWLKWLQEYRDINIFLALSFYILAIFSKDTTSLLPFGLFLITVFCHNYIKPINIRKTIKPIVVLFLIFGFYVLFYGNSYFNLSNLKNDGYYVSFSSSVYIKNLLIYITNIVPVFNLSTILLAVFVLLITLFDITKRKLVLLPLMIAFLIQIAPSAFFAVKSAAYYSYFPAIFLLILFFIMILEMYKIFERLIVNNPIILKSIFLVYFVILVIMGLFQVDKLFLNNCFLIQYPWKDPQRIALDSIVLKLNKIFEEKIERGTTVMLEPKEITHEMEFLFTTNALYLFLENKNSINYTFVYDKEKSQLLITEKSSFHQMSF